MVNTRAAHRYALAIIEVAEKTKLLDQVTRDFELIAMLVRESRDFAVFLKSPVVNTQKKRVVFGDLLTGRVSDLTTKFILLLLSKYREGLLPEIIMQFQRLHDERLGILNVTVRTAIEFTKEENTRLVQQLEQQTGKKVRARYVLDPPIRGGFIVQYDDTVWDASVHHQLERLRQKFVDGTV